jgi:phosphatidylinositol alpha-1,6-mannosyltransferase
LAALSRVYGVPSVCYLHGKEIWGRPGLTRWTLRNNTAGIVVSEHSREKTAGVLGGVNAPLHVIQPGVEPPDLSSAVKADRPTVVTVARLRDWYKGHDVMLEALREVHREVPDVRWVVVGEGQLKEEIAERAHRFGLDQVVELTGAVDDETRNALLASAHVFSMPSRYSPDSIGGEGFGLVYLEAAAFGLPVVAGDEGGPREAVVQEETGLLVDPTDTGAVASALIRLLKSPEEAHRMGMRGRERTQIAFTYDEIGARVGKVLRDYAAGEAGSPTSP